MRVGRTLVRLAPTVAVVTIVSVVAAMAVNATGQKVQRVEANNAAMWVTKNDGESDGTGGLYGRFNKAASSLELWNRAGAVTPTGDVDIHQDGNTVLVQNLANQNLIAVDSANGNHDRDQALQVSKATLVDLRGGTLAVFDPVTGKLWGLRTQGTEHQLDLSTVDPASPALAELGPGTAGAGAAGLSVGSDGSIHAATIAGKHVSIATTEQGFQAPAYGQLPAGLKSVQVSGLGSQSAFFDATSSTLILPGGKSQQLPGVPDPKAQLQQGGADVGSVAVATSTSLFRVAFDGTVTAVFTEGGGAPAVPVNLGTSALTGSCILGAWVGTPGTVVRSCNGEPAADVSGKKREPLYRPAFRVNWNLVVLNDRQDGRIYDIDLQESFNPWEAREKADKNDKEEQQDESTKSTEEKPKAQADEFGARPGRISVLHVLDNDEDPNGRVLSITKVDQPKPSNGATVSIAPDGQTLLYQQPKDGKDASFRYSINNNVAEASATVTIKARGSENDKPRPWLHYKVPTYAVAANGTVTLQVVGDYRDDDGDPITLVSANEGAEAVPVTSDGQIEFTAPDAEVTKNHQVSFTLTDGTDTIVGQVTIKVKGTEDITGIAPIAKADAVKGEVNKPISVRPLANDIPGVTPDGDDAKLTLAGGIQGWKGGVSPDPDGSRVTFVAKQPGIQFVKYKAAFGGAPSSAEGWIRVDVVDTLDDKPIAMPDQAVIRGDQPITVDVLANDSDPHGGLLTVQTAEVQTLKASDEDKLRVAVIQGRWLRIVPQGPLGSEPQAITYTIITGDGGNSRTAAGSVTVTHLPADEDAPLVRGDAATVRVGDTALIPVLANDLTQGGSTLTLATTVEGASAGQLPVRGDEAGQGDVGKAFVIGNQVRYVAPQTVDGQLKVTVTYLAKAGKGRAEGSVSVTVTPEPTDAEPSSEPQPTTIEGRATSGDTITIPVPASGQDRDGDSVALVGLGSGPQLGRVTAITPKGITYQAFPTDDSVGTDEFQYIVTDKYGKQGVGKIRVAVAPPGQTQIPVAVDDLVTARPGVPVHVDAIANDLMALSDKVKIKPIEDQPGITLTPDQGPITATAPAAGAQPVTVQYQLTGNGGDGTLGTVTIDGQEGVRNPPRLKDQLATTADGKTATVDVLADAWDPDGGPGELRVTSTSDPTATFVGGVVSIPVQVQPRVLSYTVQDGDEATSAALIYVPGSGEGLPYAKGLIKLDSQQATVSLADYVVSPRGKPIRVTVPDSVTVSPKRQLKVEPSRDLSEVELTVVDDYVGPATLNLEVTDGAFLKDPDGKTAVVSIPIQVGPETPVLRCPADDLMITRGTTGKAMDLISLCHVWTANPVELPTLAFTAEWVPGKSVANVDKVLTGQALVLRATPDASPDAKGQLEITIPGTEAKPATLKVGVKNARPASYKAQRFEVKQGDSISRQIVLDSPFEKGTHQDTIVTMPDLPNASESKTASTWTVTPDRSFFGPLVYNLTLSDVASGDPTRNIQGVLTISVYGIPAPPAAPTSGKTAENRSVTLQWRKPAENGATVERYEVRQVGGRNNGGVTPCDTNRGCTVRDLDNDVPVRFQVRAWNKAGWSDYGNESAEFRPDQAPSTVTGFTTSDPQDRRITLNWAPVQGEFSAVTGYIISWPGGSVTVRNVNSHVLKKGLVNEQTTFSIWAKNRTGKSRKAATTTGWPTGDPSAFNVNTPTADVDINQTLATVTWGAADPNGKGPIKYTVTRSDKTGDHTVCKDVQVLTCKTGQITLDGSEHTFTVVATNFYGRTSSASKAWKAIGQPQSWDSGLDLSETGNDREFTLVTTTPNSRGQSGRLTINAGGVVTTRSVKPTGENLNTTLAVPSNGQDHTVTLTLCNEDQSMRCATKSGTVNTYGKLSTPSIGASVDSRTVRFEVNAINGNGREATLVVTSSQGYSRSFPVPANGSHNFSDTQDLDYSTPVYFEARLEANSGQKRGSSQSSRSNSVTTRPRPNPVAVFRTDGQVPSGTYKDWYYVTLELIDWNPRSTVSCFVQKSGAGLKDWSGSFTVDDSGHASTGRLTFGTGHLLVQTSDFLPNTSNCRQ